MEGIEICIHIYMPDKITADEVLTIMSYILSGHVIIIN